MSDELKPCAHCGGGHVVEEWRREDDRTVYWTIWRVACGGCGMSTDWHASREAALAVWNKRADEFGADDDYERRMDELLCRLTNGKWSKSRSYSVDFMVSCVDEAYDEILDPPAESHYAPRNTRADDAPETTVDNAQADSRERLEADIKKYRWEHGETSGRVTEWLDRQEAITERNCRMGYEDMRDYLQQRVDSLEAERDHLTNAINELQEKQPYCYNPEQPLDILKTIGRYIDELTAERDELRDIIDHMPKTEQECEACQEAHDRLMFNSGVEIGKLIKKLADKQHVCDVQRDSFLKLETENAELRKELDKCSR